MRCNRSSLVTALTVVASCLGCNGAGGPAKTTAAGSTAAPVKSSTAPVVSAGTISITSASFASITSSARASAGDTVTVTLSNEVVLKGATDPAVEFVLPVKGNSFGTGATLAAGRATNEIIVTLGMGANLRISGTFGVANIGSGDASGIDVPAVATGHIATAAGAKPAPGVVDIGGAYAEQWTPAAAMQAPRGDHTATLLNDGRILVVGGLSLLPASAGTPAALGYAIMSEVYDPVANAFTLTSSLANGPTGDMLVTVTPTGAPSPATFAVGRTDHTATLLNDGTVLIAGGFGFENLTFDATTATFTPVEQDLMTAHIFDPKTNTFTQTGSLTAARSHAQATLLSSGKVIITGGLNNGLNVPTGNAAQNPSGLTSAEIFDPATGQFTLATSSLLSARFDGVAFYDETAKQVLYSGGVTLQVPSGQTTPQLFLSGGAELFDEATSAFNVPATQPQQDLRWQAVATAGAGTAYIVGGNGMAVVSSLVSTYKSGTFAAAGSLVTARARAQAATIGNTVVLVAGGTDLSGSAGHELSSCEVVNSDTNLVEAAPSMMNARNTFTLSALPNGQVIAIGGLNGDNGQSGASLNGLPVGMAEIYSRP
jgi:hypothetical protein